METIFDYNPTDGELGRFNLRTQKQIDEMKCFYEEYPDADSINYQLGLLFSMRGDKRKANKYWSCIKDKRMLSTLIQDF